MSTTTLSNFGARSRSHSWASHRENALNWLALGLLLAAWNSADDSPVNKEPRPAALRGYDTVSVRALHRGEP
jgi:hypothetical protein